MDLGRFSISLSVKDLGASEAFYTSLGFEAVAGNREENWLILQNEGAIVGLFHGMFEGNIMTFNPTDVRSVQQKPKADGIELDTEADENATGPASAMLKDPDGNVILLDQHNE